MYLEEDKNPNVQKDMEEECVINVLLESMVNSMGETELQHVRNVQI